jgi:hypothetical protein
MINKKDDVQNNVEVSKDVFFEMDQENRRRRKLNRPEFLLSSDSLQ